MAFIMKLIFTFCRKIPLYALFIIFYFKLEAKKKLNVEEKRTNKFRKRWQRSQKSHLSRSGWTLNSPRKQALIELDTDPASVQKKPYFLSHSCGSNQTEQSRYD